MPVILLLKLPHRTPHFPYVWKTLLRRWDAKFHPSNNLIRYLGALPWRVSDMCAGRHMRSVLRHTYTRELRKLAYHYFKEKLYNEFGICFLWFGKRECTRPIISREQLYNEFGICFLWFVKRECTRPIISRNSYTTSLGYAFFDLLKESVLDQSSPGTVIQRVWDMLSLIW